jgi:hypothetical protein
MVKLMEPEAVDAIGLTLLILAVDLSAGMRHHLNTGVSFASQTTVDV